MAGNEQVLIGGPFDGAEVLTDNDLPAGAEIRVAPGYDAVCCAVYVVGPDGKASFERHAPVARSGVPPADLVEALRPVIAKLAAALLELESVHRERGTPVPPLQINGWLLRQR